MSTIQEAVEKYGGADTAYKNKLKGHIRDAMGYSNYVNKVNEAEGKPLSLNLEGNITPSGVRQLVGGAMSMRKEEISTYSGLAGSIDSAADTIAKGQVSRGKKQADQYKYDTSFVFQPQDDLDQDILNYTQNPYNEDGSVKSLQQFEAETREKYGAKAGGSSDLLGEDIEFQGTGTPAQFDNNAIKDRILEHIPEDYIGSEAQYAFRFQGLGEEESTDELISMYGDMIAAGKKENIPQELFPAAFATLTPTEKKNYYAGGTISGSKREI